MVPTSTFGGQRNSRQPDVDSQRKVLHLYFFREVVRVPAWLVSLCFTDDPHCRTSADEWRSGLAEAREALGLAGGHVPHYAEVLLPARTRDELVGSMPGAG